MTYFLARILELAVQDEYPSDLLHIMLAKVNRRVQKLDRTMQNDAPWAEQTQDFVMEIMDEARNLIAKRWTSIQKSADSAGKFRLAELRKPKPQSDTTLKLLSLRPYLQHLHNLELVPREEKPFNVKCSPRINGREIFYQTSNLWNRFQNLISVSA